jgi:replicative DNA helicase
LNVPLVALSQLSRAPESRSDHRPQLADCASRALSNRMRISCVYLSRGAVQDPEERDAMPEDQKNIAELIIAKQRNGPTGTVDSALHAIEHAFR